MSGFSPSLFAGRRYAVIGLGRNGCPAARALNSMGARVLAWDDDPARRAAAARLQIAVAEEGQLPPGPPCPEGRGPGKGTAEPPFDALIFSPGIPHRLPQPHPIGAWARACGIPILSDAELLFQAVRRSGSRAKFAGITGTNGKSTTTALLAHILQVAGRAVAAGGNLGTAALALPLLPDDGVYVLEMSSYMLERIATLRFDAAAMLNISPDHLDRHGDMVGYAAVKRAIFDRQAEGDTAAVGVDDAESRAMAEALGPRVVKVSGFRPADIWAANELNDHGVPVLDMSEAPALPGAHNAQNAAAATALARAFGVSRSTIAQAIRTFPGLPHRQQRVASIDGVLFVNDSKATNADAAARALACYDRIVWIAGGIAKEGGIDSLAPLFPRIAHALLIGRDAPLLAAVLASHGVTHEIAGTLAAAVPAALAAARKRGACVILLAPACASFDQFSGFDARGDHFAELVRVLVLEGGA